MLVLSIFEDIENKSNPTVALGLALFVFGLAFLFPAQFIAFLLAVALWTTIYKGFNVLYSIIYSLINKL